MGGYQLAFLLIVPYSSLLTVSLPAAEKLRCYAVFHPQQHAGRKVQAAKKIFCYAVFKSQWLTSREPAAAVPPLRKGRLGEDDCPANGSS